MDGGIQYLQSVLAVTSFSPNRVLRLAELLEAEEQQLLQEMEEKKETTLEKQAKMREKAKALRHKRESERQQLVSEKLEQQFRYPAPST